MALLTGIFNPDAEASTDFAPIPTGEYLAQIVDSDMKPTKNNTGEYLELTYEIVGEECKGRRIWVRLNLVNTNATAVEIANRDFAAIREATGVANPRDSADLHNKPHVIRVEFIKSGETRGRKTYDRDTNEVRAYKRAEGVAGGLENAPAAAASPTPTSRSSASAAPWKRNAA